MQMTARKALAEANRWQVRAEEAKAAAESAMRELADLHRKACERFGRDLPTDALLLDVLDLVKVVDGDRWLWKGNRNNKDLATIRARFGAGSHLSERSLVRYLAIELGVISEDDEGMLYPRDGDVDDVNPFHRVLRRTDAPMGNPNRFGFTLPAEDGAA